MSDGATAAVRAPQPNYENEPDLIVGIGASAGGLEALERFLKSTPNDTGMAFVIVQHLSPDFKSLMEELLARYTKMAIHRVEGPIAVARNSIYLIPPRRDMVLNGRTLELRDRPPDHQVNMPINIFFRSLANSAGEKAVAIVLSGTGSDGASGIADIHGAGGLVFVQTQSSAKFDGMPRSAIETGLADAIVSPEEMPGLLMARLSRPFHHEAHIENLALDPGAGPFRTLIEKLRNTQGIDFSWYKPATIQRRIERRAAMLSCATIEEYCSLAIEGSEELDALGRDLLIGVTQFFRDPDLWEHVKSAILPALFEAAGDDGEIRAWVPGCATGEEAYTLAILFTELLEETGRSNPIRIFATDVHADSVYKAADGMYPDSIESCLTEARLAKFFSRSGDHFRILPHVRRMLTFSRHNLLKDPPFTRLDLVSCRNLLIYFQPVAQARALSSIHFALKLTGALVLGPSETPGDLAPEFEVLDRGLRTYRKTNETRLPAVIAMKAPLWPAPAPRALPAANARLARAYDVLMSRHVPTGVLLNEQREVLHYFGDAESYLHHPSGPVTNDVVAMARGDLRVALASAIQNALRRKEKAIFRGVRIPGAVREPDRLLNLVADPIVDRSGNLSFLFVSFEDRQDVAKIETSAAEFRIGEESQARIMQLEQELQHARESLQATVEELETSNEELQAANEELLAANEELQSTNEELHSVNEELYTVNAEHEQKIRELIETSNDLNNLIRSTEIATIFLDNYQRIRLFTPSALDLFKLLPQDIGRDIRDIRSRVVNDDMLSEIRLVQARGEPTGHNVTGENGQTYLRRISPYSDEFSHVAGVVITFVDVTDQVTTERRLRLSEYTIEHSPHARFWMDSRNRIIRVSPEGVRLTGYSEEQLLSMNFRDLLLTDRNSSHGGGQPGARNRAEAVLKRRDGSVIAIELTESSSQFEGELFLFAFAQDITARKRAEEAARNREDLYYTIFNMADVGLVHMAPDGKILAANQRFCRFLGYTSLELTGKTFSDLLHPDERNGELTRMAEPVPVNPNPEGVECRFLRKDGPVVWGQLQGTYPHLSTDGGRFLLRMVTDAGDRRRLEHAMAHSIQEKETLLKEVHHRVKNNLQLICSILALHGMRAVDKRSTGVFNDIANRVQAMALIHEKLYRSSSFSNVDFADYASGLTGMLIKTYAATPGAVHAEIEAESVAIGVDEAIPLGLILNELVSNSLKHGFPEGRRGVIRVGLHRSSGRLHLSVADDGAGLPPGLNWEKSSSLGLSIVNVLVRQLSGELKVISEGGAKFELSIPYKG